MYHAEVGLRILLGFVVRETVKYDRGVEPLFCFAREHFVRLHLHLTRGAQATDRTIAKIGFVMQCLSCAYREEQHGMVPPLAATCPHCNKPLLPIGPLYLGKLFDDEILGQMQEQLADMTLGTKKELGKILTICREELPTSSFYDYHMLAQKLATSPPAIDAVLERLRAAGYAASRYAFLRHRGKNRRPAPQLLAAIGTDKKSAESVPGKNKAGSLITRRRGCFVPGRWVFLPVFKVPALGWCFSVQ